MQPSIIMPDSVLQNSKKEPLNVIIKPYQGLKRIPQEVNNGGVECLVFYGLAQCFQKHKEVCEGLLANIIWGFEQCGYDPKYVARGLTRLRELDFIFYSSEQRGAPISETNFDPKKPIWIRYTPKMIDLFYRGTSENGIILPSV
jgi:hypothetical protein